jgi:uncharacterized protein
MLNSIELILKLTERCNLNCKYCYYFNGLDQSFKEKPAALKPLVLDKIINFLLRGIKDLNLKKMTIVFHGGEPLLLNKHLFDEYCNKLRNLLIPQLNELYLTVQTNGVLINEEWIAIFKKHNIRLGISMDGSREYHDQFRVDHNNRGSYDKLMQAVTLLKKLNYDFGVLSVIDPSKDPELIFNHFIKDLELNGLDFLWPDFTHDNPPPYPAKMYGVFISKILQMWVAHGDPNVRVRFVDSYVRMFLGKEGIIYGEGANSVPAYPIFVIRSDGEISPSDELMSTEPSTVMKTGSNVEHTSLKDFFMLPIFKELDNAVSIAPGKCLQCCWEKVCGGGGITNRFSKNNRFNNPSVYCDGLKMFFSTVLQELIHAGVSVENIGKNLCIKTY